MNIRVIFLKYTFWEHCVNVGNKRSIEVILYSSWKKRLPYDSLFTLLKICKSQENIHKDAEQKFQFFIFPDSILSEHLYNIYSMYGLVQARRRTFYSDQIFGHMREIVVN
jgi:hypothetical protein